MYRHFKMYSILDKSRFFFVTKKKKKEKINKKLIKIRKALFKLKKKKTKYTFLSYFYSTHLII